MIRTSLALSSSFVVLGLMFACSDDATTATPGTTTTRFKQCLASAPSASCTEADLEPVKTCVLNACDPSAKACYGADYRTGSYSGACATYVTCTQACPCNDFLCFSQCTQDTACSDCIAANNFGACQRSCQEPACADSGATP